MIQLNNVIFNDMYKEKLIKLTKGKVSGFVEKARKRRELKNNVVLNDVIKCQCNHKIEDRFPTELLMKECEDCNGVLTFLKMKELTKEQKIELYDLIYPKSLENDDDIKANDMTHHLKDNDSLILLWTDIKKINDWMIKNGLWS